MATRSQIRANRRNARNSTGPASAQAKAAVRFNALWHGAFAADMLLPGEDGNLLDNLKDSFRDEHRPASPAEEFLVDRMVLAAWRLRRLAAMEARVLRCAIESAGDIRDLLHSAREAVLGTSQPQPPSAIADPVANAYIRDCNGGNAVSKLARYQTALERSFYRALHELDRLRSGASPLTPGTG